jgi:hypothetical protein
LPKVRASVPIPKFASTLNMTASKIDLAIIECSSNIDPSADGRGDEWFGFLAASPLNMLFTDLCLSWANAVGHDCTAHAQRFLHALRRVSRSLMLHLGVELGSNQDDDNRKPDPDHEADTGP